MALSAERNTPERRGELLGLPVAAGKKIYKGALVVLNAGYAEPGSEATGLVAAGRAEDTVDNSLGQAGDATVVVKPGVFAWENSAGGDEITQAEVGSVCYVVDDETVAKTDGGGTRSEAGVVLAVDGDGVWVDVGP